MFLTVVRKCFLQWCIYLAMTFKHVVTYIILKTKTPEMLTVYQKKRTKSKETYHAVKCMHQLQKRNEFRLEFCNFQVKMSDKKSVTTTCKADHIKVWKLLNLHNVLNKRSKGFVKDFSVLWPLYTTHSFPVTWRLVRFGISNHRNTGRRNLGVRSLPLRCRWIT